MMYVYVYLGIQVAGFAATGGTFLVLARRDKPSIVRVAIHLLPALVIALSPYLPILFMGWGARLWLAGVVAHVLVIVLDPPLRKSVGGQLRAAPDPGGLERFRAGGFGRGVRCRAREPPSLRR